MDRIGEYLVSRLIGEGGMGKVYEAEERLSKRKVALKVLRPELAQSEDGRRLFLNEMTILAHLDHPNVVRCLACQEVDGELLMALEYLEGPTLRQVIAERGRLSWTEATALVVQIAAGLGAAHRQSPPIVHRDLKPENVIVLRDDRGGGRVKVMDFGIAKVLEAMRQGTTHSVGTLQYMSPEQIDAGDVGPRADLYALGLVYYELLCGHPPFTSASPRELLNLHCTEPPPPLPEDVRRGLPRGVERVLFALLHKRAEDRPESAEAVIEALEPFAAAELDLGGGSSVTRPGQRSPSVPPVPRGDTEVPTPVVAAGGTLRPVAHPPVRADTIGLIERASGPRQVSAPLALAIILVLSAIAGVITYVARTGHASGAELPSAAVTAAARTEP